MATNISDKQFLDLEGLTKYNTKIQGQLEGKVDTEAGKGLSANDYTDADKEKLAGLSVYTLPATSSENLGGVKVSQTTDPVPTKTALKADATGTAFVDWSEAPVASATTPGLVKLGDSFNVAEDGTITVDGSKVDAGSVAWADITDKPELALKTDITNVYTYKGSVATYDALPTTDLTAGDVYNVETTDMNYGWTGTAWDPLGSTFSISRITDEQIDALFASDET